MTRWLVAANLGVALLLSLLVWHVLNEARRDYAVQAQDVAEGIVAVAQLNFQSEFGKVDAVVRATASELERLQAMPGGASDTLVNEVLDGRYALLNGIEAIRLTDAAGKVRWGTDLPPGPPKDVSDRDYFVAARQSTEPGSQVAGPLTSRVSGHWVIAFTHPLHVSGQFTGVLYVSIDVDHFRQMLGQYDLAAKDAVSLRRDDRRLVARFSPANPVQGQVGDANVSSDLLAMQAAHPRAGSFVSHVAIDDEVRTASYRALDGWPFVVYAGISNERFFAPLRQQAVTVISLAGLAWTLVAAASWMVLLSIRREASSMQALADVGIRLKTLLRVAADGIHIINHQGRLVEMSDSFAEMLKSSRERLLGQHISSWDVNQSEADIAAWLSKVKPGDRQRVDVQHRREDGRVIEVELQMSVAEVGEKLMIFSSGRDVTTVRRLMREQSAMLENDLVGMAKFENRRIAWCNRALERILGYGAGELTGQSSQLFYWDKAQYEQVGAEVYTAVREHGRYRSQLCLRTKAAEVVWVDFGAVPLSATETFAMAVDITVMKMAHEDMAHAAFHDPLTLLPNRLLLEDRIGQALAVARRENKRVVVCYLDLDGFKAVNDEHGHAAGDRLLKAIATRLSDCIRPTDTAARLGGDEFVLVLTCVEDGEWKPVLDRVVSAIAEPVLLESGALVAVGATVGVTSCNADTPLGADELLARADNVMLSGKRQGKGRVLSA